MARHAACTLTVGLAAILAAGIAIAATVSDAKPLPGRRLWAVPAAWLHCWAHRPRPETARELEMLARTDCRPSPVTCAYVGGLPPQCHHMPLTATGVRLSHVRLGAERRCRDTASPWKKPAVPYCSYMFQKHRWFHRRSTPPARDNGAGRCLSGRCGHGHRREHGHGHGHGKRVRT